MRLWHRVWKLAQSRDFRNQLARGKKTIGSHLKCYCDKKSIIYFFFVFQNYATEPKVLKLIPVRTAHSREFVYDFCFLSCKTSQNVAFRIHLHEVNSKFHVNRHYRCEALCFILSDISLDEKLYSRKNQWSCWKKNLKGIKDKVCGS